MRHFSRSFARQDYYELLNLKRNATIPEVKERFRNLALLYHPDLQ